MLEIKEGLLYCHVTSPYKYNQVKSTPFGIGLQPCPERRLVLR